jgi:hypothetical protein
MELSNLPRDGIIIDVLVVLVVEIVLDRHVGGEIELRVECAGAVAALDRRRGGELVDVGGAGGGPVKTGLDTVALVLDLREGEVDLSYNTGHVETLGVCPEGQRVTQGWFRGPSRHSQRMQPPPSTFRLGQILFWLSLSRRASGPARAPVTRRAPGMMNLVKNMLTISKSTVES